MHTQLIGQEVCAYGSHRAEIELKTLKLGRTQTRLSWFDHIFRHIDTYMLACTYMRGLSRARSMHHTIHAGTRSVISCIYIYTVYIYACICMHGNPTWRASSRSAYTMTKLKTSSILKYSKFTWAKDQTFTFSTCVSPTHQGIYDSSRSPAVDMIAIIV